MHGGSRAIAQEGRWSRQVVPASIIHDPIVEKEARP
jgi:hypothetical protein